MKNESVMITFESSPGGLWLATATKTTGGRLEASGATIEEARKAIAEVMEAVWDLESAAS